MHTQEHGDAVVVAFPQGSITEEGRKEFSDSIMELARGSEYKRIVVDFTKTTWLSSIDVGVFAFALKECQGRGVSISLLRPNQRIRRVFETTKMNRFFSFADTIEEAVSIGNEEGRDEGVNR